MLSRCGGGNSHRRAMYSTIRAGRALRRSPALASTTWPHAPDVANMEGLEAKMNHGRRSPRAMGQLGADLGEVADGLPTDGLPAKEK